MAEAIINYWTAAHFVFGLAVAMIVSYLMKTRYPVSSVSLFVLVLWEMFEYRQTPIHWKINYLNNIADVIVGYVAIIIAVKANELIKKR